MAVGHALESASSRERGTDESKSVTVASQPGARQSDLYTHENGLYVRLLLPVCIGDLSTKQQKPGAIFEMQLIHTMLLEPQKAQATQRSNHNL